MGTLFVAAQIQKFITVAHNAFPLLFKECLKLCQILKNDADGYATGAHHRKNLVKIIRQAHVGKLVHDEMAVDRQAASVLVVGKIKELLEKLRIKDTDKKVKTRIVVWYQSEQSNFLFA